MQGPTRTVWFATLVLGFFIFALLCSVAWVLVSPIDLPFQRVDLTVEMTSSVDGHTLRVAGTSNLPDGALIDWYMWRDTFDNSFDPPGGQATVETGAFTFVADLTGLTPGAATAAVSFSCDWGTDQTRYVTDVVGEHCEHLGGDQVYVDSPGDSKQLSVDIRFLVP